MTIEKKIDTATDGKVIDKFKNYKKSKQVTVPTSFQARSHSTPVKLAYITTDEAKLLKKHKPGTPHDGPMGIPNYDDYDPDRGYTSGTAMSAMETGSKNAADRREVRASNYGGPKGMAPGAKTKREQEIRGGAQAAAAMGQRRGSNFGIGNLFSGALSMFGGWPGKAMSLLSRLNPKQLRGKNPDGSWRTQPEWEEDRDKRRNTKSIDRILNRSDKFPMTQNTINRLTDLGYKGNMTGDFLGSTKTSRLSDADYTSGMNVNDGSFSKSHLQNIDLSKYPVKNTNIISDYPNYRTPNLGGTDHLSFNQYVPNTAADDLYTTGEHTEHIYAQGGRAGYENGELVTDESMMEATPAGMMQENVEEVQGEPSREELEALAMEIFQLPLEELNEEQLMIVYQAAMQQEPMQEDIQEEDVQYAAQGGLAGLL